MRRPVSFGNSDVFAGRTLHWNGCIVLVLRESALQLLESICRDTHVLGMSRPTGEEREE